LTDNSRALEEIRKPLGEEASRVLNKLHLDLYAVYLEHWGSREEKIKYYDQIARAVPGSFQTLRKVFDAAMKRGDWETAEKVYEDMSSWSENLFEGFHAYRRKLLERGLI